MLFMSTGTSKRRPEAFRQVPPLYRPACAYSSYNTLACKSAVGQDTNGLDHSSPLVGCVLLDMLAKGLRGLVLLQHLVKDHVSLIVHSADI